MYLGLERLAIDNVLARKKDGNPIIELNEGQSILGCQLIDQLHRRLLGFLDFRPSHRTGVVDDYRDIEWRPIGSSPGLRIQINLDDDFLIFAGQKHPAIGIKPKIKSRGPNTR